MVAWLSTLLLHSALAADAGRVTGTVTAAVPKNLPNAVVYVRSGDKGPQTVRTVQMDQKGLVFAPHVLPVQVGWTVDFVNSDPVGHSVFTMDGERYDLGTWPQGQKRSYVFTKTGVYRQLCKVHDDMLAYIVVLDTARFGLTDSKGAFSIEDLPPGDYTLGVWSEKLGASDVPVHVAAGQTATVTIPLGPK